jgi:glycosyltransferase 2 family protein
MSGRAPRVVVTLLVTSLGTWYVLSRANVSETARLLGDADAAWIAAAFALTAGTVPFMAWRWQRLLDAQAIREPLPWLLRAYLVSYSAGQILPTAIGGDALRILETSRRHPGQAGPIAGIVLLERALGGAATLALAGVGFALAVGRYDIGVYLWLEGAFVAATIILAVLLFSRSARPLLARTQPLLQLLRIRRPIRAVYDGIHRFRDHVRLLLGVFALTLLLQAVRVLGIWATGEAVGVDLSPRIYYVMGPLLFLVMLVPFTINGLAVRESFFVSFLSGVGATADQGLATGLLFFLITVAMALPGFLIVAVESVRGARSRAPAPGENSAI